MQKEAKATLTTKAKKIPEIMTTPYSCENKSLNKVKTTNLYLPHQYIPEGRKSTSEIMVTLGRRKKKLREKETEHTEK